MIAAGLWHIFAGLSSFESEKSNKMLRKNQFLLSPHVPIRDSSKTESSNSTVNGNETSEPSDLKADTPSIVNQNFLMENHNSDHHIAMMNENDENYFEIFRAPMKFGTENNTEVTAQIGTTAHLPCTIHSIGEGVVSHTPVIPLFNFLVYPLTWSANFPNQSFSVHRHRSLFALPPWAQSDE